MSRIYHTGYLKLNNYKERVVIKENSFVLEVDAEHMYSKYTDLDVFDSEGNYVKTISEKENFNKAGVEIVDAHLSVVQIDYQFYLLPVGRISTQDNVCDVVSRLNNGFSNGFNYEYNTVLEYIYRMERGNTYPAYKRDLDYVNYSIRKPFEVSFSGNTFWGIRNPIKKFLNLDFNQYKKNKDDFIKENPNYKDQIEFIYNVNIKVSSAFFMVKDSQLFRKDFNKLGRMINRLNYNINLKK